MPFAEKLEDYYTIYAFDLFFHGQSKGIDGKDSFSDNEVVTKEYWRKLIGEFLGREGISTFDVAGFSMGGRFALATAEAFSDQINQLFLIAPDGIAEHPLYHLATRMAPTRWLFRQLTSYPQPLIAVTDLAQKGKLVPQSTVRIVRHMLANPQNRQTLYRSWVSFRNLSFSIASLCSMLRTKGVRIWLFVGKYDPLLPPAKVKVLSSLLPASQFVVLESGHTRLVEKVANFISKTL